MNKVYIDDFCNDLNYKSVVLFIDIRLDLEEVLSRLKYDNVGHLHRFNCVRDNRLFYIENCDLQEVTIREGYNELLELLENDYSVVLLKKDSKDFYIEVPDILELRNATNNEEVLENDRYV